MPIYRASTFMDMSEGKWNVVFYVFEYEILSKKQIDYKLRMATHHETCPEKVELSNVSDWSIFFTRGQSEITCLGSKFYNTICTNCQNLVTKQTNFPL